MSNKKTWKKTQDYSSFSDTYQRTHNVQDDLEYDDVGIDKRERHMGRKHFIEKQKDFIDLNEKKMSKEFASPRSSMVRGHRLLLFSNDDPYSEETEIELQLWMGDSFDLWSWGVLLFINDEERECDVYEDMHLLKALEAFYAHHHKWYQGIDLIISEDFYKTAIIKYVYKTYNISQFMNHIVVNHPESITEEMAWSFLYSIIELSSVPPRRKYYDPLHID